MRKIYIRVMLLAYICCCIFSAAMPVSAVSQDDLSTAINTANAEIEDEYKAQVAAMVLDHAYPVGSVFCTFENIDAAAVHDRFGGTWTQLSDRFLYVTSGNTGTTGGAATHTLTTAQIPSHSHGNPGHVHYLVRVVNCLAAGDNDTTGSTGTKSTSTEAQSVTAAGGGQAHNNMPPYITVRMFRRTA